MGVCERAQTDTRLKFTENSIMVTNMQNASAS